MGGYIISMKHNGNRPQLFCSYSPTVVQPSSVLSAIVQLNLDGSNLDGSNIDGSFTMANSNSVLSPYEILPIARGNKYLRKFSYFIVKLYVVCTH